MARFNRFCIQLILYTTIITLYKTTCLLRVLNIIRLAFWRLPSAPPTKPRSQKFRLNAIKHVTFKKLRNTARAYQLFVQKHKLRETNTPSHPHLFLLLPTPSPSSLRCAERTEADNNNNNNSLSKAKSESVKRPTNPSHRICV